MGLPVLSYNGVSYTLPPDESQHHHKYEHLKDLNVGCLGSLPLHKAAAMPGDQLGLRALFENMSPENVLVPLIPRLFCKVISREKISLIA